MCAIITQHFNFGVLQFVWKEKSVVGGSDAWNLQAKRRQLPTTFAPSFLPHEPSGSQVILTVAGRRMKTTTRSSSSAVVALDTTLVSIKIVDTQPEQELQAQDESSPPKPLTPQAAQPPHRHHQQHKSSSTLLRWFIALVPNTIFASVSGALGLAGAVTVSGLALLVLLTACVVQFFHEMALMLVETDSALLRFTCGTAATALRQQTPMKSPGSELVQTALSLLSLSCDLLAIGFFKSTLALSYCCSLYGAIAIPKLVWSANSSGSATEFFHHQSLADVPMTFVLLHGGLWLFALAWLGVTARMSQWCSHNLSPRR